MGLAGAGFSLDLPWGFAYFSLPEQPPDGVSDRAAHPARAPALEDRMTLMEILSGRSVIVGLKGRTKGEVLEELVDSLEVGDKITDRDKVLEAVLQREEIMSTGIGHGIAIPHGKSEYVTELGGVLGTKVDGVDFDALDGKPTHIFFLLVSPMDVSGPHIKALARISRLLKAEDFRQRLIGAGNNETAIRIIEEEEKRH